MRPAFLHALRPLALAACAALLLAACAGGPDDHRGPRGPEQEARRARAEAFASAAYRPEQDAAAGGAQQQWLLRGEMVAVSLAYPGSGQRLPLVVYQPGLGESGQAGSQWRELWARAGYAVLSLQPLDEDARAWSSDYARSADFKGLARHHHGEALLHKRLQMLEAALAEARQRARSGDALWARVDFERMAIAGYELGAHTALAAVGQHAPGAAPSPLAAQFRAAIALSPYAPPPEARAGVLSDLTRPVLMVSSARDADPLGWVPSPQAREALFAQLPASDGNWLLWLDGSSHQALAGNPVVEPEAVANKDRGRDQQDGGSRGGRRSGGNGGPGGGMGGGMGGGGPGGGAGMGGGMGGRRGGSDAPEREPVGANGLSDSGTAIGASSLAFLDAQLRQRPAAQDWLRQQAAPWLEGRAQWRQR